MAQTKLTYLFCLDDHRNLSDEIKKRFSDTSRYKVESYFSKEELFTHFRKGLELTSCKIAIIAIPEAKEQLDKFYNISVELKKMDPGAGIILLVPPLLADDVRKSIIYNIDAYVPISQNSTLRIHNTVKKIISEHNISINRKFRNISVYFLLAFLIVSALGLFVLYLKYPDFF